MDSLIAIVLGVLLVTTLIVSFVTAFFHGLGFSITGQADIKPAYSHRYLISIFAYLVYFGVVYLIFASALNTALNDPQNLTVSTPISQMIQYCVIYHFCVSLGTYLFFEAKRNIKAALLSPIFLTLLNFAFYYLMLESVLGFLPDL